MKRDTNCSSRLQTLVEGGLTTRPGLSERSLVRTKLATDCVANTAGCNQRVLEVAELLQVGPEVAAGFDTLDRSDRRELPFFLCLLQFLFFLALHSNGRRYCRLLSEQCLDTLDFTQSRF